jgi:hypothetical protein
MVTMEEAAHGSGLEAYSVLCDNTILVRGRPEERSVSPIATLPTTYSSTYLPKVFIQESAESSFSTNFDDHVGPVCVCVFFL